MLGTSGVANRLSQNLHILPIAFQDWRVTMLLADGQSVGFASKGGACEGVSFVGAISAIRRDDIARVRGPVPSCDNPWSKSPPAATRTTRSTVLPEQQFRSQMCNSEHLRCGR